jgi:hypothetical protein
MGDTAEAGADDDDSDGAARPVQNVGH